jgi:hypothetical protein
MPYPDAATTGPRFSPSGRLGRDIAPWVGIVSPEVSGRLDDEKLETLRNWGTGLAADGRDELRAAGKAILILIEEIERLQVDVWHSRDGTREQIHAPPAEERTPEEVAADFLSGHPPAELEVTLKGRLRKLLPARDVKTE